MAKLKIIDRQNLGDNKIIGVVDFSYAIFSYLHQNQLDFL